METRILAVLAVALCILSVPIAQADGNADLIKQLQDQKALLDAQKSLIDAQAGLLNSQKSLVDAKYPDFTGGKTGSMTFGSSVDAFHANRYAYSALETVATKICKLDVLKGKRVLLLSSDDLASIAADRLLMDQLSSLNKAYDTALKPTPPEVELPPTKGPYLAVPGLYTAAIALSSIADFTKLFRTDQTVSQEAVTLSDSDLANALIGTCVAAPAARAKPTSEATASPAAEPVQPPFFLASYLSIPALLNENSSKLWKGYMAANNNRANALALQLANDVELSGMDKTKLTTRYVTLQASSAQIKALLATHAQLDTIFTGVNDTTKEPNLLRLLRGEALLDHFTKNKDTLLLTANIVLKGGFSVVSKSIWREDKFYSRGGLAVSYRVMDTKGTVIAANVVSAESEPAEVKFH